MTRDFFPEDMSNWEEDDDDDAGEEGLRISH